MITRHLAPFGLTLPAIGQGMSGMGTYAGHSPDRLKERKAAIRAGIERGLTLLDTANTYGGGFSEEVVGETVQGVRDRCFIASKFHPDPANPAGSVREAVIGSLRRLKTDRIDLYQIHWPNPRVNLEQTMPALEKLVRDGLIRFIGLSNFAVAEFREAQRYLSGTRVFSNQLPFNLLEQADVRAFDTIPENERPLMIGYSPLNEGRLAGSATQMAVLQDIAHARGKSPAQIAMAWATSHPDLVCVAKASSVRHMDELADALEIRLTKSECAAINASAGPGVVRVPLNKIEMRGAPNRRAYASCEEAIANHLDLFPSPEDLAMRFQRHDVVLPVRLIPCSKRSDGVEYVTDEYDIFGQARRYWGWILAHGDAPIPAYILPPSSA